MLEKKRKRSRSNKQPIYTGGWMVRFEADLEGIQIGLYLYRGPDLKPAQQPLEADLTLIAWLSQEEASRLARAIDSKANQLLEIQKRKDVLPVVAIVDQGDSGQ